MYSTDTRKKYRQLLKTATETLAPQFGVQTAEQLADAFSSPDLAPLPEKESLESIKKRLQIQVDTPAAFCWNCSRPLSKKVSVCPHCGEEQ